MRGSKPLAAGLILLGLAVLLLWGGEMSTVGASVQGQSPLPTSTRPLPPPLSSSTPSAKPSKPKPVSQPTASPAPTLSAAVPGLPESGGRAGDMIGMSAMLAGGGAALILGLALTARADRENHRT